MIKLSRRLQCIARQIIPGSRVADIGSDHALLPVYLIQQGIASQAVAGEVAEGPLAAAERGVRDAGLQAKIQVRKGDGLAVISPGEIDAVTIAGMGGSLIRDILEAGRLEGKLAGVRQLLLQPNVGEDSLRRWLDQHGWQLTAEHILEEDGKIYEILSASAPSTDAVSLYETARFEATIGCKVTADRLYQMGPFLILEASPVWHKKWQRELQNMERIWRQMAASELESSLVRRNALENEMNEIREVLSCIPTDKPSLA
ncbi:tRNA (adenine(22)-N(1))-methyltransferase [Paenibacillus daejeonensis]|uniref:tRNA (adenine(22)-N(1))-methyltransferase n=1 Tax=Paenibacillus daejeonensis TaxID=135193 RepID=UPI0003A3A48B|nr:class I SAM-dependent methyltransferase [Paenibacillus daejeonensis]